jgi:hypothetical protein
MVKGTILDKIIKLESYELNWPMGFGKDAGNNSEVLCYYYQGASLIKRREIKKGLLLFLHMNIYIIGPLLAAAPARILLIDVIGAQIFYF